MALSEFFIDFSLVNSECKVCLRDSYPLISNIICFSKKIILKNVHLHTFVKPNIISRLLGSFLQFSYFSEKCLPLKILKMMEFYKFSKLYLLANPFEIKVFLAEQLRSPYFHSAAGGNLPISTKS